MRRILKAAEITQDVTPHGLRDTFASWLLSGGVQLAYVSVQLGHADVATRLGITPGGAAVTSYRAGPARGG